MSPKKYWRIDPARVEARGSPNGVGILEAPAGLLQKLGPRQGLVLAFWDDSASLGRVQALGVVRAVGKSRKSAEVTWRSSDISLRPNPAGRRWWTQPEPFFGFAAAVIERYMLDDLFAEHFPEFDEIEFGPPASAQMRGSRPSASPTGGFVYVIRSNYGFKIGKTVNMKDRTRLFGVKLPFPISIEHYAWFDDYTYAERQFHEMFHAKRLEGEWFDLHSQDLEKIKTYGERVVVDGL